MDRNAAAQRELHYNDVSVQCNIGTDEPATKGRQYRYGVRFHARGLMGSHVGQPSWLVPLVRTLGATFACHPMCTRALQQITADYLPGYRI